MIIILISFISEILENNFIFTVKVIEQQNEELVENISKNYTWTTAICNLKKECIDVTIHCENGKVKSIIPSSKLIKNHDSWIDPRGDKIEFCS